MHLVVVGLNHKTAPVELREKLSVTGKALEDSLAQLISHSPRISESAILSTCNRTEIYACTVSRADDESLIEWFRKMRELPDHAVEQCLYTHAGHKSIEHLFRVTAGIDSMMLGEDQILGQVKNAYAVAGRVGSVGPVLNSLFQHAISVGKRARTETEIGQGAFSAGSAAVQLAKSIFDDLSGRAVLIVGAGKIGELTTAHLVSSGVGSVIVANRSSEKAENLAGKYNGRVVKFEDLGQALQATDIVITSTGSEKPIISREMVADAMRARRGRPIFLVDVAVPRDISAEVARLDNVFLYNIDDLQSVLDCDASGRRSEVARVETIIVEEVEMFLRRFRTLDAVPVITALRRKFEGVRETEFEKLRKKLPNVSDEEIEAINLTMRSIVNKICHEPMIRIKEYAVEDDDDSKLDLICEVFGICPDERRTDGCKEVEDK